jgi:hypothetical protein
MRLVLIGAAALAQVSLGVGAQAQCPPRPGYPQNWCLSRSYPGVQSRTPYSSPGSPRRNLPRTARSYVPKAPQNPYGQAPSAGLSSSMQRPYSVPTAPGNPYVSAAPAAAYYAPARSQIPYTQPATTGSPPLPPITTQTRYSYKCVINDGGDFCNIATNAPATADDECTCGSITGYVE